MMNQSLLDLLWVLFATVLVLTMQGGFLALESGLTRSKNAINVAMKNVTDFILVMLLWWLIGFGMMFGNSRSGLFGSDQFFLEVLPGDAWTPTFFLFQAMFCATAATIVSGAVAERMKFSSYMIITLVVAGLIYPVYGHWVWGGVLSGDRGWLAELGFVDFAGSTVVHSVGGWVALAMVLMIGPRKGWLKDGRPQRVPVSNLPLSMLGLILFLVGWIGFNGGSTLAFSNDIPLILMNTLLAGAAGGGAAYLLRQLLPRSYLEVSVAPINGTLAGLVAITAGCHAVSPAESLLIGSVGAALMLLFTDWLSRRHIDDAIGVVPVHLVSGIWGTLAVGLFGDLRILDTGLDRAQQIGVQLLGILVCAAWVLLVSYLILRRLNRWRSFRVSSEAEHIGLNVSEHGARTDLVELLNSLEDQERSSDLSMRVPVEPFTEVGMIAAKHNRLMDALEKSVATTRDIIRDIRDGVVTFSADGLITALNPGAEKIFGIGSPEASGLTIKDLMCPVERSCRSSLVQHFGRLLQGESLSEKLELDYLRPGQPGSRLEVSVTESNKEGGNRFFTAWVRDITDKHAVEEQLAQEKERVQVTLDSIADGVISTDLKGVIRYINPVAQQLTGWHGELAIGERLNRVFPVVDSLTQMPTDWLLHQVLKEKRMVTDAKTRILYCRNGSVHVIRNTAAPIRDMRGNLMGVVVVFQDVTQSRELEKRLSYQATHDSLTDLINRREFEVRLNELLEDARQSGNQHVLCYVDLDQFKVVNDVCGHAAGDELLRRLAALLKKQIRTSDTLARLGGDEFGLQFRSCSVDKGLELAEAIRQAVHAFRFAWEGKEFMVGASIGLVPVTSANRSLSELLSHADAACYAAKEQGRNRVHLYEPDDEELTQREGQMQWIARLQQALDRDCFRLHYQPISAVDSAARPVRHFEVLLRLRLDDGTEVPPGAFIPAAERYNLMPEVDLWVIKRTLRWLGAHRAELEQWDIKCAINLSGASIGDQACLNRIKSELLDQQIPPEWICFEITETATIANFDKAMTFINELRRLGCAFSLDDFGTGLSSFGYLKNLAVDYLKIDGAFIQGIADNSIHYAMVQSINTIGHVMGLKTIAEFVDSEESLECLRTLGVDFAQGYFIGRPQPLDNLLVQPGDPVK